MSKKTLGIIIGAGIIILALAVGLARQPMHHSAMFGPAPSADAVKTNQVSIKDYMFEPMHISVVTGTTVTWTNQDAVHHSVTADTASANAPNSPLFGQGETYKFTFTKAGTYTIHCMPHPYMHATVTVTD